MWRGRGGRGEILQEHYARLLNYRFAVDELMQKKKTNRVAWTEVCDRAFRVHRDKLSQSASRLLDRSCTAFCAVHSYFNYGIGCSVTTRGTVGSLLWVGLAKSVAKEWGLSGGIENSKRTCPDKSSGNGSSLVAIPAACQIGNGVSCFGL